MSGPDNPEGETAREKRLARNEVFFRDANELTAREVDGVRGALADFLCECSSPGCVERVKLSKLEYEQVRAAGDQFFVVQGHESPTIERVVEHHETYLVVEKLGVAGLVAEITDPRDQ